VPLIGEVVTRPPRSRRNSSGLKLATIRSAGPLASAAYAGPQAVGDLGEQRRRRPVETRVQS
jgi:hypothetical protein